MRAWWLSGALTLMLWAQGAVAGTLLVVGDSISAAFGLDSRQGWVALLEKRLVQEGFEHQVVNASISGDTSAGGAARLSALLVEHKPELVIIELGGNDGLRGQPLAQLQQNLASMVEQSQQAGAKVLLLGMKLPPIMAGVTLRLSPRFSLIWRSRSRFLWCRSFLRGGRCTGHDAG